MVLIVAQHPKLGGCDSRHPYKQISTPVRRIGAATALAIALLVLRARTTVTAPRRGDSKAA
jgi:hypothetical protein